MAVSSDLEGGVRKQVRELGTRRVWRDRKINCAAVPLPTSLQDEGGLSRPWHSHLLRKFDLNPHAASDLMPAQLSPPSQPADGAYACDADVWMGRVSGHALKSSGKAQLECRRAVGRGFGRALECILPTDLVVAREAEAPKP